MITFHCCQAGLCLAVMSLVLRSKYLSISQYRSQFYSPVSQPAKYHVRGSGPGRAQHSSHELAP